MIVDSPCPVCAGDTTGIERKNSDVLTMTCTTCGTFRMEGPFITHDGQGWPSVPAAKRQAIATFLSDTHVQREKLNVELCVLGFDTWRSYVQDGTRDIRKAEHRRKSR
jgi:hypothetical protein